MSLLWIGLGGALGALSRFGIGESVRLWTRWPGWLAVLFANLVGTGLLALLHLALPDALPEPGRSAMTLGYCGALTTYSAFGLDTLLLWYEGRRAVAVAQLGATLACGAALVSFVARAAGASH